MSDPTPSPGKWSIKQRLGGLGGLLAAILLVLTQVTTLTTTLSGWYHNIFHKSPALVWPYDVVGEVRASEEVPSYLYYYYTNEAYGGKESLHWFRASVNNKTKAPLNLVVSFTLKGDCDFVRLLQSEDAHEFDPKKSEWKFKPELEFFKGNFQDDCHLIVHYAIKDELGDKEYPQNDVPITLLPIQTVKWNLVNIDKKPVSMEFLIASLSAWQLSREGNVKDRASQLRKQAGAASPEGWIKLCYKDLFQGQSPVTIITTKSSYPFEEEKTLRTPGQVLSDGNAEPLEAAFLMAALIHSATLPGQVSLTLFILPPEKDIKNPAVLLAWAAPNSDTWDAIDLTLARKLHFQENLQQSQELLKQALNKNPKILGTVADQGVSFGTEKSSPTVVAFDRAVKKFSILPLPSMGLPPPPSWPSR